MTWPDENHGGVDGVMHPSEVYWAIFTLPSNGKALGFTRAETCAIYENFQQIKHRKCIGPEKIEEQFNCILSEHRNPSELSAAAARSSFALLLLNVLSAYQAAEKNDTVERERKLSPRIQIAASWVKDRIGQDTSVPELAKVVGLRPSHFRQQFKKETGLSPIEYFARLRMREAKRLLVVTDLSIVEIAMDLGFSSSQHFATAFRKMAGFTPRTFRKANSELVDRSYEI